MPKGGEALYCNHLTVAEIQSLPVWQKTGERYITAP